MVPTVAKIYLNKKGGWKGRLLRPASPRACVARWRGRWPKQRRGRRR